MKFTWKNRAAAIRRMCVYLTCTTMAYDEALYKTLHTMDGDRYRYCNNPDMIRPTQMGLFCRQVDKKLLKMGHKDVNPSIG